MASEFISVCSVDRELIFTDILKLQAFVIKKNKVDEEDGAF